MNGAAVTQSLNAFHQTEIKTVQIKNSCPAALPYRRSSVVQKSSISVHDAEVVPSSMIIPTNSLNHATQEHHLPLSTRRGSQGFCSVLEMFSKQQKGGTISIINQNKNCFAKKRCTSQASVNFDLNANEKKISKQRASIGVFNAMPMFEDDNTENDKKTIFSKFNYYKFMAKNGLKKGISTKRLNNENKSTLLTCDGEIKLPMTDIIEGENHENYGGVYMGPTNKQDNSQNNVKLSKYSATRSIHSISSISNSSLTDESQKSTLKNIKDYDSSSCSKYLNETCNSETNKISNHFKKKQISSILKNSTKLEQKLCTNVVTNNDFSWNTEDHISSDFSSKNQNDNSCIGEKLNKDRKISDTLIQLIFKEISSDSLVTFL